MFGDSEVLNTLMPILITFLPTIGALLLVRSQSQRRKLYKQEIIACYCIFVGFLLFISWEGHWLPAAVAGGFVVVISIYALIRKRLRGVPINT